MQPTIGRIVHYTLSDTDAACIIQQRAKAGASANQAKAGDVYPAIIVRTFAGAGAPVNLQVLLDGPDTYWATSRSNGDDQGSWIWPPRV